MTMHKEIGIRSLIFICVCLSAGMIYVKCISSVQAVNMNSDQYKIQFGNINIGGKKMDDLDDDTYHLSVSLGQTAAKQFESNGYIIKAGFQYIYSKIPFTFTVSSLKADLGSLLPNTPSTDSLNLTVSYGGAGQYVVMAAEETPLANFAGDPIPNTICDGGVLYTCTTTLAKPWTSLSAYGFGYNMSGEDIPVDFIDSSYYRPFADLSVPEEPATIMQSTNVTQNLTPTPNPSFTPAPALTGTPRDITHQASLTFKVNISPLQSTGTYNSVIRFTATPSF